MDARYDYGFWGLVAFHVILLLFFGLSFLRPARRREWRSLGAFAAFVVALYTEMYGFPLTIYLLGTVLGRFPFADPFAHASGNLWASLFLDGYGAALFMGLGGVLIIVGLVLLGKGWQAIHKAEGGLVTGGIYGMIRHPQYAGLGLIIIGSLIQWPTLITLLMAPVLLISYYRLARREEHEMLASFREGYREYARQVPAFFPRWDQHPLAGAPFLGDTVKSWERRRASRPRGR